MKWGGNRCSCHGCQRNAKGRRESVCLSQTNKQTNKQTIAACACTFNLVSLDRKSLSWHRFDPEMSSTNSLDVINVYVVTPLHNATTLHV